MLRNDPAQYDGLADEWWKPFGGFAMLHWFAASRAEHIAYLETYKSKLVEVGPLLDVDGRPCGSLLIVDTGHVANGKVDFPPWRDSADTPSAPPPSPMLTLAARVVV